MKNQRWKVLVSVICVLAAGICYSCSRQEPDRTAPGEVSEVMYLETDGWTETEPGEEPEEAWTTAMTMETEPASAAELTQVVSLCYVHICGAVKNPGVYELEEGSRVFQAVERAGGFAEHASEEALNLALEVEDGMKIVIPPKAVKSQGEDQKMNLEQTGSIQQDSGQQGHVDCHGTVLQAGIYLADGTRLGDIGGQSTALGAAEDRFDDKINLNTATKAELMTLTGIGEARAEAILQYRQNHGSFSRIEDIMKVSGIKDAAFQKIKDDITV